MPESSARAPRDHLRERWLFAAIMLFGTALRLVGITRYPFEQDELYTVVEARYLFHSPLVPGIRARPLYYLLEHPLLDLFPTTELWLRLPPLLFAIAGLWATWVLARRLFGTRGAAVATVLVSISPWHLHASGMARYWSLVYLLSTLGYLSLLEAYHTDRARYYVAALLCLLLGTASHPTFVFPMLGAALGLSLLRADGRFGWRWPSRRGWTILWLPYGTALATAYLALKLTAQESAVHNWDSRGWSATLRLLPAMVEWMTPTMFVAGGLGGLACLWAARDPKRRSWGALAIAGTITGMLALFAASLRTSVYPDYGMSFLPLLLISAGGLVALAIERVSTGKTAFTWAAGLVLASGVAPSAVSHLSDGMRFDYRPAFQEISRVDPNIPVLTTPIALQQHYAPALHAREFVMRQTALDSALARAPDLWVIVPTRREGIWMDDRGEAAAWVARHCRRTASFQRPRFDYRVYRTDLYRCSAASE